MKMDLMTMMNILWEPIRPTRKTRQHKNRWTRLKLKETQLWPKKDPKRKKS